MLASASSQLEPSIVNHSKIHTHRWQVNLTLLRFRSPVTLIRGSANRVQTREPVMAYSYMEEWWQNGTSEFKDWIRRSAISWRREPVIKRVTRPTKLVTARRLGYKAKPGIVIVRVRIRRGGARKPRPVSGRRQKAMGASKFTRSLSLQEIAERRAGKRYPNMTIRSSYHVFKDGTNHWYEVILIDRNRKGLEQPIFHHRPSLGSSPARLASSTTKPDPPE